MSRRLVAAALLLLLIVEGAEYLRVPGTLRAFDFVQPEYPQAEIGGALPGPMPFFPADNWWNQDISQAPSMCGRAPGLSNLLVARLGATTTVGTVAPPGVYFGRIRVRNHCGYGPASNEIVVTV